MNVAFPFHAGDYARSLAWMQWAEELGQCRAHRIFLMPAKALDDYNALLDCASRVFGKVDLLPDVEGLSGWPQAANSLARQAAWHFYLQKLGPWMFLENDAIPLVPGWLDAIAEEYDACARPFLGELVPKQGDIPERLTGIAVYPENTVEIAPRMMQSFGDVPFDQLGADDILPRAHRTQLIQNIYNLAKAPPTFPDANSLALLRHGAVLFHRCKDGSLIDRLRERGKGFIEVSKSPGGQAASRQTHNLKIAGSIPAPATTLTAAEHVAGLRALCTDNLAKARITKQLRAAGLLPRKAA